MPRSRPSPATHARRAPAALLLGLSLLLHANSSAAASFDVRGQVTLDAAVGVGFEEGDALDAYVAWDIFGATRQASPRVATPGGLEGEFAMAFGGDSNEGIFFLDQPQLIGRRVELTLWYLPQGTDPNVALHWWSGDARRVIEGTGGGPIHPLGAITLTPTGRKTSDGWVELSTGPFDWALAGAIAPAWLDFVNPQQDADYYYSDEVHDPDAVAWIDALEIHDLGPAAVPEAECMVADEAEVCGADGVCFLGRCADAASVLGAPPRGAVREEYLERSAAQLEIFTAVRYGRQQMDEVLGALDTLQELSTREFWSRFSAAHELLRDGHGSPPRTRPSGFSSSYATCMGPGRADLLSAQTDVVPMVFDTDAAELRPGDVLVSIDGVDVDTWVSAAARLFYNPGDPAGRDAFLSKELLGAVIEVGAKAEFQRCTQLPDSPDALCAPSDRETITIDFGEAVGDAVWSGQAPAFLGQTRLCDLRFEPAVTPPRDDLASFYYFADWADRDGIRHVLFNALPPSYASEGAAWWATMSDALTAGPADVLLDQRTGMGGMIETTESLAGLLLDPTSPVVALSYPWLDAPLDVDLELAFEQCRLGVGSGMESCGYYARLAPNGAGPARASRVALVNGFDKSANDFFARFMATRSAPTRIFGYAATQGAFGASCSFAPLIWELEAMTYQCQDTRFLGADGAHQGFESGYGVEADEYVHQSMRDALRGEDTILKAAEAWLRQGGTP